VRNFYLYSKNTREIKNRYKNLIRKKTPDNIIKSWKALQYAPLTELEKNNLAKGVEWFGEGNWFLISKYFLPSRTPEFLY
jgi:hypothetical protein